MESCNRGSPNKRRGAFILIKTAARVIYNDRRLYSPPLVRPRRRHIIYACGHFSPRAHSVCVCVCV